LQHIIISDKDGSPELVSEGQSSAGEISEDDRSFCDVFSLPLSERPLPGLRVFDGEILVHLLQWATIL